MQRKRLRELGITIGELPTGPLNAITDVPGVRVGHTTLHYDEPRVARTGVTVIWPRPEGIYQDQVFAGYHSFNGNGEMTGLLWLEESGCLGSPIGITNTHQVGVVRDALVEYETLHHPDSTWLLPVAKARKISPLVLCPTPPTLARPTVARWASRLHCVGKSGASVATTTMIDPPDGGWLHGVGTLSGGSFCPTGTPSTRKCWRRP